MKAQSINFDYLNLRKEIPLFIKLLIRSAFTRQEPATSGAILIVNTCLIGEFAATIPPLRDFIERHPTKTIDLVVTSTVEPLARRIIGVRHVFTAKSVYGRKNEQGSIQHSSFDTYERTIVLRISRDVYRLVTNIHHGRVSTSVSFFARYGAHLLWCLILRRTPKRWSEVNFAMLGGTPRTLPVERMLTIEEGDTAFLSDLEALQTTQKKIIVHTHCYWPARCWASDKWIALLKKIHADGGAQFIFVGAAGEDIQYNEIAPRLDFKTYSLIGKTNLLELFLLMRNAHYFIGIDSGPRNVGHLADIPSVTILGPGPHMYTPPNPRDKVIDHSHRRGLYQTFVHTNHPFIDTVQAEEVYEAYKSLIQ